MNDTERLEAAINKKRPERWDIDNDRAWLEDALEFETAKYNKLRNFVEEIITEATFPFYEMCRNKIDKIDRGE